MLSNTRALNHGLNRTRALRAKRTLIAAAVVLPLLASCGFKDATDAIYTQGNGVNDRSSTIDILNAVIVTNVDGEGTVIASFSNNTPDALGAVTAIDSDEANVTSFQAIEVGVTLVNLAATELDPITVTGEFAPGDFVPLTFTFDDGSTADLDIPVVCATGIYAEWNNATEETLSPRCAPRAETAEH